MVGSYSTDAPWYSSRTKLIKNWRGETNMDKSKEIKYGISESYTFKHIIINANNILIF